jgi:hypothetical protein
MPSSGCTTAQQATPLRLEVALALRRPQREIPSAVERDDTQRRGRRRRLGISPAGDRANRKAHKKSNHARHARTSLAVASGESRRPRPDGHFGHANPSIGCEGAEGQLQPRCAGSRTRRTPFAANGSTLSGRATPSLFVPPSHPYPRLRPPRATMSSPPLHDPLAAPLPGATTVTRNTTCYMCACRCGIRVHVRTARSATSRATRIIRSTRA